MIVQADMSILFRIAKFVNPKIHESIQDYTDTTKRIGYVVRFKPKGVIIAIWFDAEKLSERDLKYIFKNHKESDKQFFINYLNGFYRIGFKI